MNDLQIFIAGMIVGQLTSISYTVSDLVRAVKNHHKKETSNE